MKTGIYEIQNKISGKSYIGLSKDIEKRLQQHIKQYQKETKWDLYLDMQGLGVESFEFKVLEICKESELSKCEKKWIKQFKHQEIDLYNKSKGGEKNSKKVIKQNLVRNHDYFDEIELMKLFEKKFDIVFLFTKKGTGKTHTLIRRALIDYLNNDLSSGYVRKTKEQKDEFASKFNQILINLGWKTNSNEIIKNSGFKRSTQKNRQTFNKNIIHFLSINEAMKYQSSAFDKMNYLIFDEIIDHFTRNNKTEISKIINLISTILRDNNTKIIFISNLANANDLLFEYFKVENEIENLKSGQIKKYKLDLPDGNILKYALYHAPESKNRKVSRESSVANKISYITEYGKVINSDEFAVSRKNLKYIKTLGDFKFKLNLNGTTYGIFVNDGNLQITDQYNNTGKTIYYQYADYQDGAVIGDFEYLTYLKNLLINHKIEFKSFSIFENFVELFTSKSVK